MAYVTKKNLRGYIDFHNLVVDYSCDEVEVFDRVRDVARLYPTKSMDNLIVMCTHGDMTMKVSDHSFGMHAGDVMICPPRVKITDIVYSDDFDSRVIRISNHLVQSLLSDKIEIWHHAVYTSQLSVMPMSDVNKEEFYFYFSLIRSKMRNNVNARPCEILLALLRALLLDICFVLEHAEGLVKERKLSQGKLLFNRFLNLLSNSEVKRLPISYYAGQLAITPKYLTMVCQKYSDKTASEWVAQYTIEEIRFYLKSTELSIKEISAKMGFSNMSHFGSYVRKYFGMSPSEYRYSNKEV